MFSAYASVLCISPILNLITQELDLTAAQGGLLFSAPVVTLGLVAFVGGFLGDRIGPRRTAGTGALLLSLAAFLRGASPDFAILVVLNLLVGAGWGLLFPNIPKLIRLWFPDRTVGTATGVYSTGVFAGGTLGLGVTLPMVLPAVASWRGVCYFWGILALAIAGSWWILAREPASSDGKGPIPSQGSKGALDAVLRNKHIWIVAVFFAFAANVTFYIITGWFPTFFVEKGFTESASGFLTSLLTLAGIPAVLIVPFASDRVGLRRPFLWVSCLIAAVAFFSIMYTPYVLDVILMGTLGVTLTATYVICLFLPLELVRPGFAGTASGVVISAGYIGGALGPLMAGYLKDLAGTLIPSIVLLTALMVISMVLVFMIPETGWRRTVPADSGVDGTLKLLRG
jgi:CP family cyanate transporter-like MFS transporter